MKCVHCDKDLKSQCAWITQYDRTVCIECYELISGRVAKCILLN